MNNERKGIEPSFNAKEKWKTFVRRMKEVDAKQPKSVVKSQNACSELKPEPAPPKARRKSREMAGKLFGKLGRKSNEKSSKSAS